MPMDKYEKDYKMDMPKKAKSKSGYNRDMPGTKTKAKSKSMGYGSSGGKSIGSYMPSSKRMKY